MWIFPRTALQSIFSFQLTFFRIFKPQYVKKVDFHNLFEKELISSEAVMKQAIDVSKDRYELETVLLNYTEFFKYNFSMSQEIMQHAR